MPLSANAGHLIPKPLKPDFESIASDNGKLYVFGSGSTTKRNVCAVVDPVNKTFSTMSLVDLYQQMREKAKIGHDDLNIEGAVFTQEKLLLFQRGNGLAAHNGIFIVDKGSAFSNLPQISYRSVQLPEIDGVQSTFTDAAFVDGILYFLASAEDSASTYHDGEVKGTILGTLDNDFKTKEFIVIGKQKFEGMTVFENNAGSIKFVVCEDNDADLAEAGIYLLTIAK